VLDQLLLVPAAFHLAGTCLTAEVAILPNRPRQRDASENAYVALVAASLLLGQVGFRARACRRRGTGARVPGSRVGGIQGYQTRRRAVRRRAGVQADRTYGGTSYRSDGPERGARRLSRCPSPPSSRMHLGGFTRRATLRVPELRGSVDISARCCIFHFLVDTL